MVKWLLGIESQGTFTADSISSRPFSTISQIAISFFVERSLWNQILFDILTFNWFKNIRPIKYYYLVAFVGTSNASGGLKIFYRKYIYISKKFKTPIFIVSIRKSSYSNIKYQLLLSFLLLFKEHIRMVYLQSQQRITNWKSITSIIITCWNSK